MTDDGAETDLDLGHYERFTGVSARQRDNVTSGRIYRDIIATRAARRLSRRHRPGHPARHQRDQGIRPRRHRRTSISCCARSAARSATSKACRSSRRSASCKNDLGRGQTAFVHTTLVPYIAAAGELKTKPTQHSVRELTSLGIQPDILLCRCDRPLPESERAKIALFCNVRTEAVIPALDADQHLRRAAAISWRGARRRSAARLRHRPMRPIPTWRAGTTSWTASTIPRAR